MMDHGELDGRGFRGVVGIKTEWRTVLLTGDLFMTVSLNGDQHTEKRQRERERERERQRERLVETVEQQECNRCLIACVF